MSDLALPEITRPDADSARMVQRSIAHLAGRELQLTEGFYRHLFAMLPEARALFPEDMAEQRGRLLQALLSSVQSLHDPTGMEARLEALGEIHYFRGIADDQYQYVGHALIRTVREVVPADWSTWLSSAWISVYSWMIQHMVVGAERARAYAESGSAEASFEAAQLRYTAVQARTGSLSRQAIPVAASAAAPPVAYPARDHPAQGYAVPPPERYRDQQYRDQQHGEHPGEQHPAQVYAGSGAAGSGAAGSNAAGPPCAAAWVRFPQLAEVGEQPVTGPGAMVPPVQPGPRMSPAVNGPAVPVPEFSFAATPAVGTELSWFGDCPDRGQVTTVFPRRRRGSGLV